MKHSYYLDMCFSDGDATVRVTKVVLSDTVISNNQMLKSMAHKLFIDDLEDRTLENNIIIVDWNMFIVNSVAYLGAVDA